MGVHSTKLHSIFRRTYFISLMAGGVTAKETEKNDLSNVMSVISVFRKFHSIL